MPSTGRPRCSTWSSIGGRVGVVDRRRASGEDDACGRVALDFFQRSGAGQDDGEDVLFADATRDELRVLRAEVEDDDRLGFHYLLCQRTGEDSNNAISDSGNSSLARSTGRDRLRCCPASSL